MSLPCPADEISLASLRRDIDGYGWNTLRQDLLAGLSVAFLTVPQSMAYALLAGLPISCGLFAAIYSALITALFGSSRHLVVGPSNALAILIQSGTADILYTYYRGTPIGEQEMLAVQILTQLTLVTAFLQMIAAWAHLGRLIQFVSYSVVIGYVSGATLAVVINQLYTLLGIPRAEATRSLYEGGAYLMSHLHQAHWMTACIGVGSILLMVTLKRLSSKIPAALITLVVASVVVASLGISSFSGSSWLTNLYGENEGSLNVEVIGDSAEIHGMVPTLQFPFFNWHLMNGILPVAVVLALLSVIDTGSVAKGISARSGQTLSLNQEIFGMSLGNLVSSFLGAMPVSVSPSRTYLNYNSGAQTRFAAVFNALFVAVIVFLLGFVVTRIPVAALSGLLLVTSIGLLNISHIVLCARSTSADAFVLWTTVLSCLFFSLDIAFYIGVTLSICLYLKKASLPQLVEYDIDETGDLRNVDPLCPQSKKMIRVIKVDGELFFGAADLFQNTLKTITEDDTTTRVIILQLKNARDIDATVCLALQQLYEYLQRTGRGLVACGMTPQNWEVLNNSGLVDQIGRDNLFTFDERHPHLHMQQALQRAKQLIKIDPVVQAKKEEVAVTTEEVRIQEANS